MKLDFSRPGKPTDNLFIKGFDGRLKQECLNENWILFPENAKDKVETCRRHYNGDMPHSALGDLSAKEFAVLTEIAN